MVTGYDPDFIGDGISIPLPGFGPALADSVLRRPDSLREAIFSDHSHFTLVMNRHTRQVIYSAHNIDQELFVEKVEGKKGWSFDDGVGNEHQLGNDYYKDRTSPAGDKIHNPYDRGHMVMRFNNVWGETEEEADEGGRATFIYANAALQHENFNRDEWKELEMDIIRGLQDDTNGRLAVFTGPIYGDLDREVHLSETDKARVPAGFFKVIGFRLKGGEGAEKLGVYAFAIFQDAAVVRDRKGSATVKTDRDYQVTITELQNLTGIEFGADLLNRNPLFYTENGPAREDSNVTTFPERIPLNGGTNLVTNQDETRCDLVALADRRLIIASAMVNPQGKEAEGEWINLHNVGSSKIKLDDWTLADSKQRQATLKGDIEPGGSLRLDGSSIGTIKLSNSGGGLMLHDEHGCVIDHVTWSSHDVKRLDEGVAVVFGPG